MRRTWLISLLLAFGASPLFFGLPPARADFIRMAVGVSCDPASARAFVRIGYAHNYEEPKYPALAGPILEELSQLPTVREDDNNASCKMMDGRDVRVRSTNGPYTDKGKFVGNAGVTYSVWVGQVRIISAWSMPDPMDQHVPETLLAGIVISGNRFFQCQYKVGDRDAYHLTDQSTRGTFMPLDCLDEQLISAGEIDLEEYPHDASTKVKAWTRRTIVSNEDGVCKAFNPEGSTAAPVSEDGAFRHPRLTWEKTEKAFLKRTRYLLFPSAESIWLYQFSLSAPFYSGSILFLSDKAGKEEENLRRIYEYIDSASDFIVNYNSRKESIVRLGYTFLDLEGTPYNEMQNFDADLIEHESNVYILYTPNGAYNHSRNAQPDEILIELTPDLTRRVTCVFSFNFPHL